MTMNDASILDLVSPPAGYAFEFGAWLTHDVAPQAITRYLLPALAGMGTAPDHGSVVAAPGELPIDALTIVAAGDRIATSAAFPTDVVRVIPHTDAKRRLHAKAAVLYYSRTDPNAGPAAGALVTLITSANLTRSGLTRNREVYAAEWLPSTSRRPCLAIPVLRALRAFKNTMAKGPERRALGSRIEALWKEVPKAATARADLMAHSLTAKPPSPLYRQLLEAHVDPADIERVTLVGPAFADDHADVAKHLAWMLSEGVAVDLVVDTHLSPAEINEHGGRVQVPSGLLAGLESRVGPQFVTVYGSSSADDSGATRRLHGKAITVHTTDRAYSVVGSANLTVRGLTGLTREMVALIDHEGPHDSLAGLNCAAVDRDHIDPTLRRDTLPDGVTANAAPVSATFTPDPGQNAASTVLRGTIVIHGHTGGTITFPDGSTVRLVAGQAHITIDPSMLSLTWTATGTGEGRPVMVGIMPTDDEFWTGVPLDIRPDPIDPLLALLRQDIARALASKPSTGSKGQVLVDDGFHLPLDNRLNILARYRRTLRSLPENRTFTLLQQFFRDPLERRMAGAVSDAALGHAAGTDEPILQAVNAAFRAARALETP
jgi:hypothetical protein